MDFIHDYLGYVKDTEPPYNLHRWCAITSIGALLGRSTWLAFGHGRIFPNLFTMVMGEPAVRKSTAIKLIQKLLQDSGYSTFAAKRTSKEKFLMDLEGLEDGTNGDTEAAINKLLDSTTASNLWGKSNAAYREAREVFIVADEFNQFSGEANRELYTILGDFWDWDNDLSPFEQRFKNSKSVSIWQPTVSILGGNTPELFSRAFPPDTIGSGFLSRMLLIHGERSSRRYADPPSPNPETTAYMLEQLRKLRSANLGELKTDHAAKELFEALYTSDVDIDDVRFKYYNSRRYTQLKKLCIILAASYGSSNISSEIVIEANTVLHAAERYMPKAIGEFGKNKDSDVANKIMELLDGAAKPLSYQEIHKQVYQDISQQDSLKNIINNLTLAGKLQFVNPVGSKNKGGGFLPKKTIREKPKFVDWTLLTQEEQEMLR